MVARAGELMQVTLHLIILDLIDSVRRSANSTTFLIGSQLMRTLLNLLSGATPIS